MTQKLFEQIDWLLNEVQRRHNAPEDSCTLDVAELATLARDAQGSLRRELYLGGKP
jgi:hypothetical protein